MPEIQMPSVILFRPKFPENVGSAARACANMGSKELIIVAPRNWDITKAEPLATGQGAEILHSMRIEPDLQNALKGFTHVFGTTARTGGWRRGLLSPQEAATMVSEKQATGERVALVFGPEDRGLTNAETEVCGHLITIPTAIEASSLNLAQAVLVVLYTCFTHELEQQATPAPQPALTNMATHEDLELLFSQMKEALLAIDYIKHENSEYWMLPVRRFLTSHSMKRFEFNMLMGICRQVQWIAQKKSPHDTEE